MSTSINKVIVLGNVTRDTELRNTSTGKAVATFSVATSQSWKDAQGNKQEKSEFHNIVAWGKLADICGSYVKKGIKVYIEGALQTRAWDGQDGVKKYKTEIVAENVIMLSKATSSPTEVNATESHGFDGEQEIKVEDIPFN